MLAVCGLSFLSACRDAKVKHYSVEREPEPALPAGAAAMSGGAAAPAGDGSMAGTPVATAQGSQLTWTVPAEWKDKPGSAMRKGSYAVPGPGGDADLAITAFPGDVGGDLANVNRWRGQLALPPIAAGELEQALERFSANGLEFAVVDLAQPAGEKSQRMLGAIVPHDGATWFFKLSGPAATVAAQREAFLAFLRTVKSS